MVTVIAHPASAYSRTIDALNALAVAGITDVTFTAATEP